MYRQDPVFIVGQAAGLFIYSRNLWFIYRPRSKPGPPLDAESDLQTGDFESTAP